MQTKTLKRLDALENKAKSVDTEKMRIEFLTKLFALGTVEEVKASLKEIGWEERPIDTVCFWAEKHGVID